MTVQFSRTYTENLVFTFCRDVLPTREARAVQARARPKLGLVAEEDRQCEVASQESSHTETK